MGISTALNGAGTLIMALIVGYMTDTTGDFVSAQIMSGSMVVLSGFLAFLISPISNKYKILWHNKPTF